MSEFSKHENEAAENSETRVERVISLDEETLTQIMEIENACFSEKMAEDEEELRKAFADPSGIYLKLLDKGMVVGYISSCRQDKELGLLQKYDPEYYDQKDAIYLHSIAIKPEGRNLRNFNILLKGFLEEASREGYKKITTYARTEDGFSRILQKRYGAKFFRTIKNWRDAGEDMDYLEIDLPKKEE